MPLTDFNDSYDTDGSGNIITLNVTIGYAQIASTGVFIDGNQVVTPAADPNGNYANSFSLELDTNLNLEGKMLIISTAVTQVQPTTAVSEQIELVGGVAPKAFPLLNAVSPGLGAVTDFRGIITFN